MSKFTRLALMYLLAALLLIISNKSFAQDPTSESQLKQEAAKYFDQEDYASAYPLYSQLLSLYPEDPTYNYRTGACMLFTKADKEKPIDYLELAIKKPKVDNIAYF
ncbi:MAG TPA: hypothetical protein VNZ45_10725, partial [Bacteroidia bacterium]|nr:hypothetical protein [Bacteroidia bacterium]